MTTRKFRDAVKICSRNKEAKETVNTESYSPSSRDNKTKPPEEILAPIDAIEVDHIDRDDWPELHEPIKNNRKPFPMMALPKVAQDFCESVSSSMAIAKDFAGLATLGAMACAIGASTRLEIKPGWCEYAVLWLALCARPGAAKTPSLNACFKPIRGIQKELNLRYSQAMNSYREKLAQAKKDPTLELPTKPAAEFLLIGDITQEALVRTLSESPRGGAILSDELTGWLGSHDKYSKGGNDRQAYLSLWSSLPLSVHRKLDGVAMVHLPILSVVGGLTPSSLPRLHGGAEDGFLSRILIACPEERQGVYTKQGISTAQASAYGAFIRKLWELEPEHLDETGITPRAVHLSEDAEELFEGFYNEMQASLSGDAIPAVLRGSFSKAPSQVARIALVLHCGRQASGEESDPHRLSADCMDAAIMIARYFLSHLEALDSSFHHGFTREQEIQSRVIGWLRNFQEHCGRDDAGWTELRHGCRRALALPNGKIDDQMLQQCLESLEATGIIKIIHRRTPRRSLKPLIAINPNLTSSHRPKSTNNPKIGEII